MDDNHLASRYTAGRMTRREWKTNILTDRREVMSGEQGDR